MTIPVYGCLFFVNPNSIPTDVGDRDQVENALKITAEHYGGVDVLINNAGIVQVGPLEQMDLSDFEEAMRVHFWDPLYTMTAVVPIMRAQGGGRIINISSIGGEVAVPHLSPYVASKFALTGLSESFEIELARDNILVSTINPGLMRTGSPINAMFKGQHEKEQSWFTIMNSLPPLSMSAERAARFSAPGKKVLLSARSRSRPGCCH
jgi:NAD(P)-dependent dehydrogenase (short-subunit alcohol dehydrogenase family)